MEFTVEKVCEIFNESGVKVEGVDVEELGLYLALNHNEQSLRDAGILEYCPRRKNKRGRRPVITGCGMEEKKEKRFLAWTSATSAPSDDVKHRLLSEALKVVLLFIMNNHVYTFNGQIKKQAKGGPIGLELTGALAQIFMMWWDRRFKVITKNLGLSLCMYKRYVDDINVVMKVPESGVRWENGILHVTDESKTEDQQRSPDERCMTLLKSIGNTIHQSIEIEVDYPSNHQDGKLPILDLKVWVERRETNVQGKDCEVSVIFHEFYSKDMASKLVIHARSAIPWQNKRSILTQEVLRVLLNCSSLLPWERTVEHVNNVVLRMQYSGYSKKFRFEVVHSALKAYRKILALDEDGVRPLYRPKEWNREEREKEKEEKKRSWYKKGGYTSVIFVPATPGSNMKKILQRDVQESGLKIKIVEQAGMNIKRMLQKSDVFKGKTCNREDCLVCRTGGKGPCEATGVTYEVKCGSCEQKYIGETSRNAYIRGREHLKAMDLECEQSVLFKHSRDKHQSTIPDFIMNVTGVFRGDAMLRQITEAVKINKEETKNIMNTKAEWNYPQIPKARICS